MQETVSVPHDSPARPDSDDYAAPYRLGDQFGDAVIPDFVEERLKDARDNGDDARDSLDIGRIVIHSGGGYVRVKPHDEINVMNILTGDLGNWLVVNYSTRDGDYKSIDFDFDHEECEK